MSHVDNWMLLLYLGQTDELANVNHFLRKIDPRSQQFRILDEDSWGGTKVPEVDVYGMAANHLPKADVLQAVKYANWYDPEMSALVLSPQEGGWFFWPLNKLPETL